jgi:uncharacterized protein (TIGR03000 family)
MIGLAFTIAPAYAAHGGGGGGGGGGHGGGGHGGGGGYHGGGGYGGGYGRGGYGGYGRGFGYGGIGIGIGLGDYGGYGGYAPGYFSNYGDSYPSNDYSTYSNYYNPPAVQYVGPNYGATPSLNYDESDPEAGYSLQGRRDTRAHVNVEVPDGDAQVFFDGDKTSQTGTERAFVTPALPPGQSYHYTIEARWMENGKQMKKSRTITVNPGGSATVIF